MAKVSDKQIREWLGGGGDGNIIPAIKKLRAQEGVSLKAAVDRVKKVRGSLDCRKAPSSPARESKKTSRTPARESKKTSRTPLVVKVVSYLFTASRHDREYEWRIYRGTRSIAISPDPYFDPVQAKRAAKAIAEELGLELVLGRGVPK